MLQRGDRLNTKYLCGVFLALWSMKGTVASTAEELRTDETTHLAFVAEKGLRRPVPSTAIYDFGGSDSVTSPSLEHTFTLRNEGETPITIDRIQPSCICVAATFIDHTRATDVRLAPGEQARLQVRVVTANLQPGMFDKYVWIYADGKRMPVGGAEIKAKMRRLIGFSPASLEFGLTVTGKPKALSMTALIDSGLVGRGEIPVLASTNPHLTLAVVSTDPNAIWNGKPAVSRTYRITLGADSPAGVLKGAVYFVRASASQASHTEEGASDDIDEALNGVSMPIRGEVIGDIGAVPWAIVFGSVVAGNSAVQEIALLGTTEDAFKKLTLSTTNPYLKMALRSPKAGEQVPGSELFATLTLGTARLHGVVRILRVTLGGNLPPGAVKTAIHIASGKKSHIDIPVYYDILK